MIGMLFVTPGWIHFVCIAVAGVVKTLLWFGFTTRAYLFDIVLACVYITSVIHCALTYSEDYVVNYFITLLLPILYMVP